MDKLILCLANSYKEGGRCIAGIEVELEEENITIVKSTFGIPNWIRPVSHSSAGEIPMYDAMGIDVLSLTKIHDVKYAGSGSHSEDYYYSKLEFIQSLNPSDSFLRNYTDSWHNTIFGNRGRALTPDSFQNGDYSLMLIRAEGCRIYLDNRYKPKSRIEFDYCGNKYDFPITDPGFLYKLHNNDGLYRTYDVLYIVASLAVEHEGWHSKLAATIILPALSNIKESFVKITPKPIYKQPKPVNTPLRPAHVAPKRTYTSFRSTYTPSKPAYTPTTSKNTDSSGGCYVATSIYGSYDCPEVWALRRYRDYKLSRSYIGRLFVKVYYATSPTLVKWFGNSKCFKLLIKPILDIMVSKLNNNGYNSSQYQDKDWK